VVRGQPDLQHNENYYEDGGNIDASDTLSEPQLKVIQTRRDNAIGADFTLFATVKSAALPEEEADAGDKPKRVREAQR